MTTTARELAEKWALIIRNKWEIDNAIVHVSDEILELIDMFTKAIEEGELRGEQRGRESVLNRVPKSDEIQKESDDHYVTLEGRMIYFDKAFRHGVDFVIAKLKEPT